MTLSWRRWWTWIWTVVLPWVSAVVSALAGLIPVWITWSTVHVVTVALVPQILGLLTSCAFISRGISWCSYYKRNMPIIVSVFNAYIKSRQLARSFSNVVNTIRRKMQMRCDSGWPLGFQNLGDCKIWKYITCNLNWQFENLEWSCQKRPEEVSRRKCWMWSCSSSSNVRSWL